ncbi:MAG: zinc dependent phospholipase C family protein [Bacteroidota bacterium]|nr:zinc dependent phospholipase C family protein [Bacteroidota bacterium]
MKKKLLRFAMLFFIITGSINLVFSWGSWGHKHISRASVFALPESMRIFYYNHIDFITESAVVPDLRRALINDRNEGPRHYIDIENFGNIPIVSFPKTTKEAYTKYDSSFLNKTGYLPWYIQNMTEKLTQAFKKRNKSEILFLSAELSHYVADAHMPLHTSSNHDGQKTNQKGVHALWESILPQMFGDTYNFKTETAKYIDDIPAETWKIINQSHALVDTLLAKEELVRKDFTKENMYKRDSAGKTIMFYNSAVFSDAYASQFNKALGGMVENQLRLSIYDVACFWYTAWVNGGSPDLILLDDKHLTEQNRKNYKSELKSWEKGKLLNLSLEKE